MRTKSTNVTNRTKRTKHSGVDSAVQVVEELSAESGREGRKGPDGLTVRERFVLAALDEIEEVGFARFSLRRVAAACGVSCAAPYKHFRNKREIVEAVLRYINTDWDRRVNIVLGKYKDLTIREKLVELSLEFVRFMVENPQFRSILMIHDDTFDSDFLKIKAGLSAKSKELIKEYCQEVGMPETIANFKMYVVRSLLYGASLMFGNCELVYNESSLGFVRAAVDREFDLPWTFDGCALTPELERKPFLWSSGE